MENILISTKEHQYLSKALGEHDLAKLYARPLTKEELQQVLYCMRNTSSAPLYAELWDDNGTPTVTLEFIGMDVSYESFPLIRWKLIEDISWFQDIEVLTEAEEVSNEHTR